MMRVFCPHCDFPADFDPAQVAMSPFTFEICGQCGLGFNPKKVKRGRTDAQRRSKDQETKAARRYKARRQAGSGSSSRAKGDIRSPGVLRGECKETTAKSFSLKLSELMKIEKEARGSEQPLFEVQFQGVYPFQTYVVLPAKEYQALIDERNDLREIAADEAGA